MKKTRSMKWRLVIPFCLILIFQTIFMMAFLSTGNVAQSLYQTELRSLKKDVENSGLLLEREVLQHWMNDIRSSVTIQTTIQSVLKEEGKKASDISHDWELNERIIGEIMPDVLELLHRSYGNSIYVVLDLSLIHIWYRNRLPECTGFHRYPGHAAGCLWYLPGIYQRNTAWRLS